MTLDEIFQLTLFVLIVIGLASGLIALAHLIDDGKDIDQ